MRGDFITDPCRMCEQPINRKQTGHTKPVYCLSCRDWRTKQLRHRAERLRKKQAGKESGFHIIDYCQRGNGTGRAGKLNPEQKKIVREQIAEQVRRMIEKDNWYALG